MDTPVMPGFLHRFIALVPGFFDAMVSVDVLPNVISFNAAIGAAQWPAALRILEDIEEVQLGYPQIIQSSWMTTI